MHDQQALGIVRSPQWRKLRQRWLASHPTCAACGRRDNLNVHHIVPVHIDPSRELDDTNLLTLCEHGTLNCHLWVGHLGEWVDINRQVLATVADEFLRLLVSGNWPVPVVAGPSEQP